MDSLIKDAQLILEGKEYFMLVQHKHPKFRVIRYGKDFKDVSEKGTPQKFTKDAAEKALLKFDYHGDYKAVPWTP